MNWKVVFEKNEDGSYTVTVPALPGCISQGDNKREAIKNIKEAISLHLSAMAEDGEPLTGKKETAIVAVKL